MCEHASADFARQYLFNTSLFKSEPGRRWILGAETENMKGKKSDANIADDGFLFVAPHRGIKSLSLLLFI